MPASLTGAAACRWNHHMGPVWLALRADLRMRWQAMAGLAVLLGLIGGVVLTAAAGARRTDTAYPRMLEWAHAAQVDIIPNGNGIATRYFAALSRLPQVASMSTLGLYQAALPPRRGRQLAPVLTMSSPDRSWGVSVDRVKVLAGRIYSPRAAGQAMINPKLADAEHLRPGGMLRLLLIPNNPKTGNPEPRLASSLSFRVSAVVTFDTQLVPGNGTTSEPTALLSPPFTATAAAARASYGTQADVRLRPGASMAGFVSAAAALAKRYRATGGKVDIVSLSGEVAATQRAIRPQAVALALFAGLATLIALAVIVQLLSRQLILDSADFPILRALGMTRARLVTVSLTRTAAVTVAGGLIAVGIAIAASPLMPIGAARLAEPGPGVEVNVAVLTAGLAIFALVPLAMLVPAAWRAAGRERGPLGPAEPATTGHVPRLASWLGSAGSMTGGIGVRMAFESGHGRTAVPVRSALIGTTVAVASVLAAVVFGASLLGLVSTPHRYGQNWAQVLDLGFGGVVGKFGATLLAREPALTGYAAGNYGQLSIGTGQAIVPAIGIDPVRGHGFLTLLAGRAPAAPDEIVLGAQTMRAVHRRLGQTVRVLVEQMVNPPSYGQAVRTMRIVGVAIFPAFSRGSFTATDLGSGAAVQAEVLSEQSPQTGCAGRATCYNFFLLRYRPGADARADGARLSAAVVASGCPPGSCLVSADQRPSDIRNYTGVRDTPLLLGGVLAMLAVGTLTHVLLTSLRRRRRDLALLKTLGLLRPELLRVVFWQASALAAAALLIGLPLGLLAGRWAWALFAGSAGVAPGPDIPVPIILAAIPVTLLLANLIAAGPGWAAARISPASVLRSE
jgi:ABC-type antimicrobial peptide transport system permease subunit